MKIQNPFFKHDINAECDPKIVKLLAREGNKGYGIYWRLVEFAYRDEIYQDEIDIIANHFREDEDIIQRILDNYDLFYRAERKGKKIYTSERIELQKFEIESKSKSARKAVEMREAKRKAEAETQNGTGTQEGTTKTQEDACGVKGLNSTQAEGIKPQTPLDYDTQDKDGYETPTPIVEEDETPTELPYTPQDVIVIHNKILKRNQAVSNKNRQTIENIIKKERIDGRMITLEDWTKMFKNANRGWKIDNVIKKPNLTQILDNWDLCYNDTWNFTGKSEEQQEQEQAESEKKFKRMAEDSRLADINFKERHADYDNISDKRSAIEFIKKHYNGFGKNMLGRVTDFQVLSKEYNFNIHDVLDLKE
ncbi:MAG: hypothetical protein DKM24_00980 [Candidatus Melainabacteria bacterium]|nr:MAG: hypothetical protein DKM24_00980 [Candidatus Melainabacteria bacterium]